MNYKIIQTIEELEQALAYCREQDAIALDLETTGLMINNGKPGGWGFGTDKKQFYIPTRHTRFALTSSLGYQNMKPTRVARRMKTFFDSYEGVVLYHNAKFDTEMMAKDWWGKKAHKKVAPYWLSKRFHDTAVMAHILDENRRNSLKPLCVDLLGDDKDARDEVDQRLKDIQNMMRKFFKDNNFYLGKDPKNKRKKLWREGVDDAIEEWNKSYVKNFCDVDIPLLGRYCCDDISKTYRLFFRLFPLLTKPGNEDLVQCYKLERKVAIIAGGMELRGMKVDVSYFQSQDVPIIEEMDQIQGDIWETYGQFDLNSSQQLAEKLLDLKVPLEKTEKGNWSTDKSSLKKVYPAACSEAQVLIELVWQYKRLSKLHGTYVRRMLRSHVDGVIHGGLNTYGTVTGRLSSSEPNLQNLPKDDKLIRTGFIAREGYTLFCLDYDQMEMRLAAHFSKDPMLVELIEKGLDPYQYLAAIGEGIRYDDVPKRVRKIYKTVWLATQYGAGEDRLLKVTKEASKIRQHFYQAFPAYQTLCEFLTQEVYSKGYVNLIMGRRRRLKPTEVYKAGNSLIQGSGAMMVKKAMARIEELLRDRESNMLLQVHDELLFEIKDGEEYLIEDIKNIMEDYKTVVPMTVGVDKCLENWSEKEKYMEAS